MGPTEERSAAVPEAAKEKRSGDVLRGRPRFVSPDFDRARNCLEHRRSSSAGRRPAVVEDAMVLRLAQQRRGWSDDRHHGEHCLCVIGLAGGRRMDLDDRHTGLHRRFGRVGTTDTRRHGRFAGLLNGSHRENDGARGAVCPRNDRCRSLCRRNTRPSSRLFSCNTHPCRDPFRHRRRSDLCVDAFGRLASHRRGRRHEIDDGRRVSKTCCVDDDDGAVGSCSLLKSKKEKATSASCCCCETTEAKTLHPRFDAFPVDDGDDDRLTCSCLSIEQAAVTASGLVCAFWLDERVLQRQLHHHQDGLRRHHRHHLDPAKGSL